MNPAINFPVSSNLPVSSLVMALALLVAPGAFADGKDPAAIEAKFKAMDTNADGVISRAEHAAATKKRFTGMDANHDGVVSAAEMSASQDRTEYETGPAGRPGAEKIKGSDLDSDGRLTISEHAAGAEAMFAKRDADGDGFLSLSEVTAGPPANEKRYRP